MKFLIPFLLSSICIYVLLSLPTIFGMGYEIDWVEEATLFQKIVGYITEGITLGFAWKIPVSILTGLIVNGLLWIKKEINLKE